MTDQITRCADAFTEEFVMWHGNIRTDEDVSLDVARWTPNLTAGQVCQALDRTYVALVALGHPAAIVESWVRALSEHLTAEHEVTDMIRRRAAHAVGQISDVPTAYVPVKGDRL